MGSMGRSRTRRSRGPDNQYDYGRRMYDPRVARFMSVDPVSAGYAFYSPYQYAGNSPIANLDLDGGERKYYINEKSTYSGTNSPNLANTTEIQTEDLGKEASVRGMFNMGSGSMGKGTRIDYFQRDETIKNGKVES